MQWFSDFLITVVLTGLFCAVSELLLPWRFFGAGRMMRALCAAVLVMLIVRPVFSLLLSGGLGQGEIWSFVSTEGEDTPLPTPEEHVERLGLATLAGYLEAEFSETVGQGAGEIVLSGDINELSLCIYCDRTTEQIESFALWCRQEYGIPCTVTEKEPQNE